MCGTPRNSSDETCSYCGYIYEDNIGSQEPSSSSSNQNVTSAYETENEILTAPNPKESSLSSTNEATLKTMDGIIIKNGRNVQEGALLLTSRRLLFARGESIKGDSDLQRILHNPEAFSIPLEQVASVSGNRGFLRPSLKVVWRNAPADQSTTKTEFMQKNGPRNLDDAKNAISEWGPIIERAAVSDVDPAEFQTNSATEPAIDETELRTRVLEELDDKQWKGFFQIERDLREKYGDSIDPDALESCCSKLVKEKLVEQDKHGEFFKKIPISQK